MEQTIPVTFYYFDAGKNVTLTVLCPLRKHHAAVFTIFCYGFQLLPCRLQRSTRNLILDTLLTKCDDHLIFEFCLFGKIA